VSGNEIHAQGFGLSRLDVLGGLDLVLIRLDCCGGCVGCFVCYEPDFCLTNDNMGLAEGAAHKTLKWQRPVSPQLNRYHSTR
jgi:hypothetical protein